MKTTLFIFDFRFSILNPIFLSKSKISNPKSKIQNRKSIKWLPLSILTLILCFFSQMGITQTNNTNNITDTAKYIKNPKPSLKATRITKSPKIDGQPNDDCWKGLPFADDFIMHQPQPYKKSPFRTEVKIAYDDVAIYVLGYLYDSEPQNIRRELSQRDNLDVAADRINLGFDTYNDDQNAFRFGVTAAGVQFDSRVSDGNNSDFSWDAVWESAVSIQKDGWVAEYKIPFSALRFADKPIQEWGLQIARGINRAAEEDSWAGFDPKINGIVIQYGTLTHLENIKPPLRLQFSPYLATGVQRSPSLDNNGNLIKYGNQKQLTGGLDVKYGINQSFTLDMTLIPNFGQVQSDNQVLNLSPFEVQFNEYRPFFTEGADIFSKGDIFYSRRIGGTPQGFWNVAAGENEVVKNNPQETQLYNATKISGRTKNNVGVGFLNAITAPMYAEIENTKTGEIRTEQTADLTNYNMFVVNKAMKNNSEISFSNASTVREGDARDANVSALYARLRDKKNKYQLYMSGRLSQIFENAQDPNRGFTTNWNIRKVSGSLGWNVGQEIQSNKWNPNDLGIFQGNNYINHFVGVFYQQVEPNKVFQTSETWFNVNHNLQYSSKKFMDYQINTGYWGRFKNQWWANLWYYTQPSWTYDYFEPRVEGKQFRTAPLHMVGTNFGTDERKKLYWFTHASIQRKAWEDHNQLRIIFEPRYRVNNRLSFSLATQYFTAQNEVGFANLEDENNIIFGRRDRNTVENTLSMKLSFNAKANLTFRGRHYWSKVTYDEFFRLKDDGSLANSDWKSIEDRNINFFNIDMIYTWQFAPGSFMNVIWKNSINKYESGMDYIQNENYLGNISKTFQAPQTNTLTLKVIYFLDYLNIENKLKRKKV